KNIKDHITKIETPSFPSKESLVAEFVKCIETTNSLVSKDVTHLISKQKELSDERRVQLSPEFAALPVEIQKLTMNDIVNFKVEISNLDNKTQENVSTFKEFCLICVDDSASIAKTIVAYEEAPLKQAEFEKDFTELPLDPESNVLPGSTIQELKSSLSEDVRHEQAHSETSSHVVVAEIHTTSAKKRETSYLAAIHTTSSQKKGKQHTVAESSNKNDKVYDVVNANQTSCDGSLSHKLDDTFRYEAGSVEHVMTSEEIAKKKEDEEIIKRKNEENKASHAEVMRVIEEEARSLQIQKNSATRAEEDKQLEIKYKNRKLRYDRYVRVVNPQCRFFLKKITVVDILSRKGPFSVMVFGEGFLNMKVHNPLNLCEFNYDEWMEIMKCMVTKTSKQAKIILDNIEYRVKELSKIEKNLGLVSGVPLSELDPMIEYHGILNKRNMDDIEKEGSFVYGMDCDLSIPLELVNKDLVYGQVLYEPEFGLFFKNRYRDSHVMSAEKEFIRLVKVAIKNKNDEYPNHKRIKLERMDMM
ncbi:hypothetical protein Tco_0567385, partial [Tanacetum coccineum]